MNPQQVPSKAWPVAIALILNAIPLIGVLFWGWSAFALIFLYWFENVVIGVRTLFSMAANALLNGVRGLGFLFIGPFFTVHYGIFCAVHGAFVVAMFGRGVAGDLPSPDMISAVTAQAPNLLIGFASIVAWQLVQFVLFCVGGKVRSANMTALMAAPYPRIIVLHITILLGGALVMALNQPVVGVAALALLKAAFDVAEARGQGVKLAIGPKTTTVTPS